MSETNASKEFPMSLTSSEWKLFHKNHYDYFVDNNNQSSLKNLYARGIDGSNFSEYDSLKGAIVICCFWCDERHTYIYTPLKIISNYKSIPSINWSNGYIEAFTLTKDRKMVEIGIGNFKVIIGRVISELIEDYLERQKYKKGI